MQNLTWTLVGFALIGLFGCGGEKSIETPLEEVKTNILGTWETSCEIMGPQSLRVQFQFSQSSHFTVRRFWFADSGCTSLSQTVRLEGNHSLSEGGYLSAATNGEIAFFTFYDPKEVKYHNETQDYDSSDWQTGVEKQIQLSSVNSAVAEPVSFSIKLEDPVGDALTINSSRFLKK